MRAIVGPSSKLALAALAHASNAPQGAGTGEIVTCVLERIERARVVGVLDAWAAEDDERYWVSGPQYFGKSHYCTLWHAGDDKRVAGPFQGETTDAARAAAAKAIEAHEV